MRYDCSNASGPATVYVLVKAEPGHTILQDSPCGGNNWIKYCNGTSLDKLVDSCDLSSFSYVVDNNGNTVGYEASFQLSPGSYNIAFHTQIAGGTSGRTSATEGHPRNGVCMTLNCPTPTPTPTPVCIPDSITLFGCPDDVRVQCYILVPGPATVTAVDSCNKTVDVVFNESKSNGESNCNNVITRTWTATSGPVTASCDQVVIVNDITPPVMTCPWDANDSTTTKKSYTYAFDNSGNQGGTVSGSFTCDEDAVGNDKPLKSLILTWTNGINAGTVDVSGASTLPVFSQADGALVGDLSYVSGSGLTISGNFNTSTTTINVNTLDGANGTGQERLEGHITYTAHVANTSSEDLGCNPETIPECTGTVTVDNCGATVSCNAADTTEGCDHTRTITYTASDSCGNTATCERTFSWKVDTTPPELANVPAGGNLGCNPSTLPECDSGVTATDDCDGVLTPTCTAGNVTGDDCSKSQTFTYSATDECGNSVSQEVTYTWTTDTTPPEITCPSDITVNAAGACCEEVTYGVTVSDNCGLKEISYSHNSGSCFPIGTTQVTATAADNCDNASSCSFKVNVLGQICVSKFYDYNGNGTKDDGEVAIAGWKIKVSNGVDADTQIKYTGSDGSVCFNVAAGTWEVKEILPGSTWLNTTGISQSVVISSAEGYCSANVVLGNVCLGAGGGLTIGYWSNKNGANTMNDGGTQAPELLLLSGLCLRNADGTEFNPTTYTAYRNWLLSANAVNMAYMLSAQLSAMELNVEAGFVSGDSLVYAGSCGGFISINSLMSAANAALCDVTGDGYTPDGDPNRATQECLKNALDKANNNKNFVQTSPCPFTTPY